MMGSLRNITKQLDNAGNSISTISSQLQDQDKPKQKPSKRQQAVDEKIERLLIAYKHKDENTHKRLMN